MSKRLLCGGYYLPEELIEYVLLRLPPKSLIRCKSVCKSWNTLIKDQKFIDDHLQVSIKKAKNNTSSLSLIMGWTRQELSLDDIFCRYKEDYYARELDRKQELSLLTIFNNNDDEELVVPSVFKQVYLPLLPRKEREEMGYLTPLLGLHCNGILCLVDTSPYERERIVFYNPAIRECKFLLSKCYLIELDLEPCGFGFGHDSRANDYKFVRILHSLCNFSDFKVELYSLKTDCWREIELNVEHCCVLQMDGVCFEGFCHWLCGGTILSFDMSEEIFYRHPLPPAKMFKTIPEIQRLRLWNGSMAYFVSPDYGWFSTSFEMWVIDKNNGGAEGFSWIKHLTIGPIVSIYSPVFFWNEDELLMDARDGRFVSYNLYTKKLRKLPIYGALLPYRTYADFYVESLVSVKRKES